VLVGEITVFVGGDEVEVEVVDVVDEFGYCGERTY
jgi:hypothetical protein